MSGSTFSVPGGHGHTISFTVSGAAATAIASAFARELANLEGAGALAVGEFPTHSIDVKSVDPAGGTEIIHIKFPPAFHTPNLTVTVSIPPNTMPADAATLITNAINAQLPGEAKLVSPTVIDLVSTGRLTKNSGPAKLKPDVEHKVPTVPAGKTGFLFVDDKTPGAVIKLPKGDDFVLNISNVPLVFDASSDPNILSTGSGSTTVFGGATGGSDVAVSGNNLFQALPSGGGNYLISLGSGNDTVWANSGDNSIFGGTGTNLVGLGSGSNLVVDTGSDTILASTGNATVFGGVNDLVFGNQGSLLFAGGGAGTSATVVGSSGAETLFGAGGSGLFFVGTGAFLLVDGGGADTVVAGAGASSVTVIDNSGGSVVLFSGTDNNQLVAGGGNETLNALGTSGTNALWAGSGADSLIGGTGTNIFAFVAGGASVGGNDTIGNWTAKDTLSLIGYTASQISQTTVGGSAVITLSDGTKITIAGVPHISNIFHS